MGTKSKAVATSLPAASNAKARPSKDTIVVVKSEEDPKQSSQHATVSDYNPALTSGSSSDSDSDTNSTGDSDDNDSDGSSSGSHSQSSADPKHSLSAVPAVIYL